MPRPRLEELKKDLDEARRGHLRASQDRPDHRPGRQEHLRGAIYQPGQHAGPEADADRRAEPAVDDRPDRSPRPTSGSADGAREQRIAMLEHEKKKWIRVLMKARRTVRQLRQRPGRPASMPSGSRRSWTSSTSCRSIKTAMADEPDGGDPGPVSPRDRGRQGPAPGGPGPDAGVDARASEVPVDGRGAQRRPARRSPRWTGTSPSFEILAKSQKDPVRIPSSVVEPTVPIRPSRVLYIGMGLIVELRPGDRPGLPAGARRPLGEGPRARDPRADPAARWAWCPGSAGRR